jgi:hypothetical protein
MLTVGLLLSACVTSIGGGASTATPAPEAVFTSAAQTAEALRIERFSRTATMQPESLIKTSVYSTPTATSAPTEAPASQVSPTSETPVNTGAAPGEDKAEFVADITIPDGSILAPNQTFQKIWRILNSGKTTWTTEYVLIYIDGDLMGASPTLALPTAVNPGEKVDIAMDLVAPPEAGSYRGYWELRNADGKIFGFGANGEEAIWVDIVVQSGLAEENQTAASATRGAVSTVSLNVDEAQVQGGCPHTFIFTAQITLNKPATLTYNFEAGSVSGSEIRLPLPATKNLETGATPVVYELTVPANVEAWARLHVTQPVEAFSNQVNFSLVCG